MFYGENGSTWTNDSRPCCRPKTETGHLGSEPGDGKLRFMEVLQFFTLEESRFQAQFAEGIGMCLETEDSVGLRLQMVLCAFILLTTLLQFSPD